MKVETVSEQLLFSTLRIETSLSEADAPSSIGTGFIVSHKWTGDKEGLFLITNKHVVRDAKTWHVTFTQADKANGTQGPSLGQWTRTRFSGEWRWIGHPSDDIDITALPLASVMDQLREKGKRPYCRSIPTALIPDRDALEEFDAVEEVLFVGYPSGIYDSVNNLPIFRKGTTATPLSVDYDSRPIFLIDASVFPGSSGSPVMIYNRGGWTNRAGVSVNQPRLFFLGVLGAAFFREEDGSLQFEEIPTVVRPMIRTTQMIDLGVVYKARTVIETIEHLLRQYGELPAEAATTATI